MGEVPKIQLPYHNTFDSIREYKKAFLSRKIDFFSFIGSDCPICGNTHPYRQITPYQRNAIDLFPEFNKELIPIARFLCQNSGKTFSLLPFQLIPYWQYTVDAVIRTLLLALGCRQAGQTGFWGACCQVHPDSLITPWLIACWLNIVVRGLQRAHAVLRRFYDLDGLRISERTGPWDITAQYASALTLEADTTRASPFKGMLSRYTRATSRFLFGTPSQERLARLR